MNERRIAMEISRSMSARMVAFVSVMALFLGFAGGLAWQSSIEQAFDDA